MISTSESFSFSMFFDSILKNYKANDDKEDQLLRNNEEGVAVNVN